MPQLTTNTSNGDISKVCYADDAKLIAETSINLI